MNTNGKAQRVALDKIVIDFTRNVRTPGEERLRDTNLQADIALNGQQTPLWLEEKPNDDNLYLLRGNKRAFNMKEMRAKGIVDPKTATLNDAGEKVGGKVFEYCEAVIYRNLTDAERIELTFDQGQVDPLGKDELFRAYCMLRDAGLNEKQTVIRMANSLNQGWKPKRPIKPIMEDGGKDLLDYHKGTVAAFANGWRAPIVLQDLYIRSLKMGRGITNDHLKSLYNTYRNEEAECRATGVIVTRAEPGPKFLEAFRLWQESQLKKAAGEDVSNEAKAIAMAKPEIESTRKQSSSRILSIILGMIMGEFPNTVFGKLNGVMTEVEKGLTPEQQAILKECSASHIFANLKPAETVTEPEPATESVQAA